MSTLTTDTVVLEFGSEEETNSATVSSFVNERIFGIRAADIDERRNSASMLINKMYAWRGYGNNHQITEEPNRITLTASDKGKIVGTLSLGVDSEVGLLADQVFKDRIDPYRKVGKVCEIIKLAIDPNVKSKVLIASLFNMAFLYARDLHQVTDIIIEVNPRHSMYYQRMLGFETICESRSNPRVEAPAVLLRLPIDYVTAQLEKLRDNIQEEGLNRSLYTYFFSRREEVGIIERLKNIG